ncbi:MAG TPA: DUF11 domain-containing protein [Thermoanaerobaculia bacterium]|nr:DUF11 domain-containing protein [Thermoanaerobaculia bacterium]
MRSFLLALFLLAPLAAAQQKELVLSATPNKPEVVTGERVTITATVTNQSSQTVTNVTFTLGFTRGALFTAVTAPEGWTCTAGTSLMCERSSFAAGATATITATAYPPLLVPNEPARVTAIVAWRKPNDRADSISVAVPVVVRPAALQTDLAVTFAPPTRSIRLGETALLTLNAINNGPADASNVIVQIGNKAGVTVVAAPGSGWSCAASSHATVCSRSRLNAGETAALDVRVQAPQQAGRNSIFATVFAEEMHDAQPGNNFAWVEVSFGNAEDYERVLIPIATWLDDYVPGEVGSLWEATVHAFIDSASPIELFLNCYICIPTIGGAPLRQVFDAVGDGMLYPSERGTFVPFRRGDAAKVTFNIRVRDRTREAESWGTEIPAVREHEFRTDRIILMPLPLDRRFRHTVRVYDDGFSNGGLVAIRVFYNSEAEPRVNIVRRLEGARGSLTPAALPRYPGYTQLDPIHEANAQDAPSGVARVEIEPLTPGMRFWAFATVTNNATSHVTTVTPQ